MSNGFRFPYGPVSIITPFNFPYEIPILQTVGALLPGNKVLLKVDSKVSLVMEHFVRLLDYCGMPKDSLNLMHSSGPVMQEILERLKPVLR
jgi:1-pyrroline-5-carboxylate dehydrogenase